MVGRSENVPWRVRHPFQDDAARTSIGGHMRQSYGPEPCRYRVYNAARPPSLPSFLICPRSILSARLQYIRQLTSQSILDFYLRFCTRALHSYAHQECRLSRTQPDSRLNRHFFHSGRIFIGPSYHRQTIRSQHPLVRPFNLSPETRSQLQ